MVQLPLPTTWSVHPPGLGIASPEMVQRGQYVDATRVGPAISRDVRVIWGGAFWCCWHCEQFLTISSILFVSPGHQTMLLAIPFMWEMLGCLSCRSSRTPCCPSLGMMTLLPHNTHPLCTDSSSLRRFPHFFLLSISPSL